MFEKKCLQCGNSVKQDFEFCPFCGMNLASKFDKEDYGFLGKNDFVNSFPAQHPFMENLFTNAMKLLEKQMKELQREMIKDTHARPPQKNSHPHLHIQFFVNGKKVFPHKAPSQQKLMKTVNTQIQEKFQKHASLPRKEPEARLRRFSGKLIYELQVPGVKSVEDVLINRLEHSIEVKALGESALYTKQLKLNLPVIDYTLKDDTLIIELASA
jgi:hypothetical protein